MEGTMGGGVLEEGLDLAIEGERILPCCLCDFVVSLQVIKLFHV